MSDLPGIKREISDEIERITKQITSLQDPNTAAVAVQSGISLSQKAALISALHKALEHAKAALALCEPRDADDS